MSGPFVNKSNIRNHRIVFESYVKHRIDKFRRFYERQFTTLFTLHLFYSEVTLAIVSLHSPYIACKIFLKIYIQLYIPPRIYEIFLDILEKDNYKKNKWSIKYPNIFEKDTQKTTWNVTKKRWIYILWITSTLGARYRESLMHF